MERSAHDVYTFHFEFQGDTTCMHEKLFGVLQKIAHDFFLKKFKLNVLGWAGTRSETSILTYCQALRPQCE